jgi:hypothetical protein
MIDQRSVSNVEHAKMRQAHDSNRDISLDIWPISDAGLHSNSSRTYAGSGLCQTEAGSYRVLSPKARLSEYSAVPTPRVPCVRSPVDRE